MKKKILFVTCTRADYGKLKSTIINIQKNKKFDTKVFVYLRRDFTQKFLKTLLARPAAC